MTSAITADESISLNGPEVAVRAAPFFMSDSQSRDAVSYEWRMNGEQLNPFGDRNVVNLRAPEGGSGESNIRLEITHSNKILQIARSLFTVQFNQGDESSGTRGDTNFFGAGS
jgi:hypothetical protein